MGRLLLLNGNIDRLCIDVDYIGKRQRKIAAIIDTGSYHSFMGIKHVRRLGYEGNILNREKILPIYGITSEMKWKSNTIRLSEISENTVIHAACMIKIKHIKIGDIDFPSPAIWIPISITFDSKKNLHVKYIKENILLIGTDLLRMMNYGVEVDDKPVFVFSKSKENYRPEPDDSFLKFAKY